MTNFEKYRDEVTSAIKHNKVCEYIDNKFHHKRCMSIPCDDCFMDFMIWLVDEYEEPEVDWSQVEVDTPILVKNNEEYGKWERRYFSKYEDGKVFAWVAGATSWSSAGEKDVMFWKYAKLAEEGGAK